MQYFPFPLLSTNDPWYGRYFPILLQRSVSSACWSLWKYPMEMEQEKICVCVCVTWDICGRRLISLRLTACGSRLLSNWQSSTPSLRAWARSHTWHTHTQTHKHTSNQITFRNQGRMCVHLQMCVGVCETAALPVHPPMWPGGSREGLDSRSATSHTAATTPSSFSERHTDRRAGGKKLLNEVLTNTEFRNQLFAQQWTSQIVSQPSPDNQIIKLL